MCGQAVHRDCQPQNRKGHKGVRCRPRCPPESMVVLLVLGLVLSFANAQFSRDFTVQRNHNMARVGQALWG